MNAIQNGDERFARELWNDPELRRIAAVLERNFAYLSDNPNEFAWLMVDAESVRDGIREGRPCSPR